MATLPPEVITLAERGAKLIVLWPNSKIPIYPRWQAENCSSDLKVLQVWQDNTPNCNWALVCGSASNISVTDVDRKIGKDGFIWLQHVLEEHGPDLLDTMRVRTPGGGFHIYHLWVPGIGKDNTGKLAPGVDIQGEISYVVIPPSTIDGVPYRFEESDPETTVPAMPQWLAQQLLAIFAPKPEIPQPK